MACSPEIPEKATLRVRFELAQDSTDGEKYRKPLVNLPYVVDAHSNEEDHEIALDLGGHEMRNDLRHCWSPSSNSSRLLFSRLTQLHSLRCVPKPESDLRAPVSIGLVPS